MSESQVDGLNARGSMGSFAVRRGSWERSTTSGLAAGIFGKIHYQFLLRTRRNAGTFCKVRFCFMLMRVSQQILVSDWAIDFQQVADAFDQAIDGKRLLHEIIRT